MWSVTQHKGSPRQCGSTGKARPELHAGPNVHVHERAGLPRTANVRWIAAGRLLFKISANTPRGARAAGEASGRAPVVTVSLTRPGLSAKTANKNTSQRS